MGAPDLRPIDAAKSIVALRPPAIVVWGTLEHFAEKEAFPTVRPGIRWALQTAISGTDS